MELRVGLDVAFDHVDGRPARGRTLGEDPLEELARRVAQVAAGARVQEEVGAGRRHRAAILGPVSRSGVREGRDGAGGAPVPDGDIDSAPMRELTVFESAGGMSYFEALVARFYEGVASDPELRAIYPEADLAPAQRRLTLVLVQYWGGPNTYSDERGHPRLRMRHFPFAIGPAERDRWLVHMRAAIDDVPASDEVRLRLHEYVTMGAEAMRNRD